MRRVTAILLVLLAFGSFGCSGDSSNEGTPKVEGKVEIKDMPEGTSAPGDKRPTPADTGSTKDSGERG
jgi:hypothetical protein